ncbi:MAG: hypothetical protein WC586_08790 [Methanoregula sp.]
MEHVIEATEDEATRLALEGHAIILGGVEVHLRFIRHEGNPGILVEYTPPFRDDDCPDWMVDINSRLTGLCHRTVMKVTDPVRSRLLQTVEQDGGADRMIYQLLVSSRMADDGTPETYIIDYLDPAFAEADQGVMKRADKARWEIERMMKTGR